VKPWKASKGKEMKGKETHVKATNTAVICMRKKLNQKTGCS